jgi:hypothetical protein
LKNFSRAFSLGQKAFSLEMLKLITTKPQNGKLEILEENQMGDAGKFGTIFFGHFIKSLSNHKIFSNFPASRKQENK